MIAPPTRSDAALLRRVIGEYREMPGLCLTLAQACRLFDLSPEKLAWLVGMLVDDGMLKITANGRVILAGGGLRKARAPEPEEAPTAARAAAADMTEVLSLVGGTRGRW